MQEMSTEMATKENQVRHAAEMYHQAATEKMTQRVTKERKKCGTKKKKPSPDNVIDMQRLFKNTKLVFKLANTLQPRR